MNVYDDAKRFKRVVLSFYSRFVPQALILVYHRVTKLVSDPQLLCVSPQNFIEHLKILKRHFCPIRLQQLVQDIKKGRIHPRSVVLTFDDGYADNLYNAEPLLKQYNIPATFFVTTGNLRQEREFWWDELERILLQPGVLPQNLSLNIGERIYQWDLGSDADYSQDAFSRYCKWNVMEKSDPTARHNLYRSLYQILQSLFHDERLRVLDELRLLVGNKLAIRQTYHCLSTEELRHIAKENLIEIGAHSVTHPVFSSSSIEEQRREIFQSKVRLEEILSHPLNSFSYPYGAKSHYTEETISLIKEAGFVCACANFTEVVRKGSDYFKLPRFLVRDWDRETFLSYLGEWFRG